jgi:hypothetical protein
LSSCTLVAQDAPLLSDSFPVHSSPKDARGAHGSCNHACHQEDATEVQLKKLDHPSIRPPSPLQRHNAPLSSSPAPQQCDNNKRQEPQRKVHPHTKHVTFFIRVQLTPPTIVFFSNLPLPSLPLPSLSSCFFHRCCSHRPPLVPCHDAVRKKGQCFSLA